MDERIKAISEKLKIEEEKRNERQKNIQNLPVKPLKKDSPPRFKTMEDNFYSMQNQYEQYRKKTLDQIKEDHKPIRLEDIKQHQKQIQNMRLNYHKKKRNANYELSRITEFKTSPSQQKYQQSKFLKQILNEEARNKSLEEQQLHEQYKMYTKRKQFGEIVREMYMPKISRSK